MQPFFNKCLNLLYGTVWSCFEKHVHTTYSGCEQKLPWMTRKLTALKNNKAKKTSKNQKIAENGV
jgi:hypothetical protein